MISTLSNPPLYNCSLCRGCLSRFLHSFFKFPWEATISLRSGLTALSPTSSQTSQFVVVIHRHLQTSRSCRRSFGLQDWANLVPEYISFVRNPFTRLSLEDVTPFFLKALSSTRRFSWRAIWTLVVRSSWCFPYKIQPGSVSGLPRYRHFSQHREIYHRLSPQTRKFQWISTSPMMCINMVITL